MGLTTQVASRPFNQLVGGSNPPRPTSFTLSRRPRVSLAPERLFLALWPNAATVKALQTLWANLAGIEGRLTPQSNLHITLVFLGGTEAGQRRCVEAACADIDAEPIEIKFEHIRRRARSGIVWIEPAITPPALIDLVNVLEAASGRCGLSISSRLYRAHVTLARDARRLPVPLLPASIVWTAETFCLVKSVPGPGGSSYTIEREWVLGRR